MEGYNFYMINLTYSPERKETMYKLYDKENLICVTAIDGSWIRKNKKIILPTNLNQIQQSKYSITYNEIACTASHIYAIKKAYENKEDEVFIIEDDTHNTYKSLWEKNLRTIISEKPNDAECIIFFTSDHELQRKLIAEKKQFIPHQRSNGTGVYYINRNGMKKMYDKYIKNGKVDLTCITGRGDLLADASALYPHMNTYHYTCPTFIDECKTSTIHQRHITRHEKNNDIIINYFIDKEITNSLKFDDNNSNYKEITEEIIKKVEKEEINEQEEENREWEEINEQEEELNEVEEKIKQMNEAHNIDSIDDLIKYKVKQLNKSNGCTCDRCNKLMKEIEKLIKEKNTIIKQK